ncbi:hypothetical protein J437_LFUL010925 [Ladona fulva]|uniref:Ribosomal biogenesis protein LAS1L n=1 Tax=Ladona fulva TaxID=123851 RepID=A0A8K0KIB3_LADFU|nr:hypothetical protein J437_LFUL010925 [Ladona fulva]
MCKYQNMSSVNNGILQEYEVVPWRSREEWYEVCDLIFSDDLPKLQEAYEKLRCWKARCHRLAAGIECTLTILEPMVMHQKLKEPSNELVIKSVYALAITRFLNTATSFGKDRVPKTLYKIAESLNIPEWIVNIRHEAAHSPDLPSLDVLQAGVQFSLQWLRSIYWGKGLEDDQPEKNKVYNYNLRGKLQKWCEIYQEVYLQKLNDILLVKDVRDPKLMKKVKEYMWGDGESISSDEEDLETSEAIPSTINALLDKLVMRLNSIYHMAVKNKCEVQKVLKCFLEVSEFLPCKRTLQKYTSEGDEVSQGTTWHMRKMWIKVIKDFIQNNSILLQFINELVNYNSGDMVKDLIASCWVRDIARGIVLAQVALQMEKSEGGTFRRIKYYNGEQETEIYKKAKGLYRSSVWGNAMKLSLNNIPTTDDLSTKRKLSENKKRKIMKFIDLILNQTCYIGNSSSLNEKIYVVKKADNECNTQLMFGDRCPLVFYHPEMIDCNET